MRCVVVAILFLHLRISFWYVVVLVVVVVFFLLFGLLFNFFFADFVFTHATVGPCRRCKAAHRPRLYVYFEHSKNICVHCASSRLIAKYFECDFCLLGNSTRFNVYNTYKIRVASVYVLMHDYILYVHYKCVSSICLISILCIFLCLLFHRLNYILSLYFRADCSLFESLHRFIYTYVCACASFSSFTFFP